MSNKKYDVIIIGSGIGGLVCGCYLAKAGLKVLIIEKNNGLGGYCTSFSVQGYTFNTCVRGFVGGRSGGLFDKILSELSLNVKLLRPEVYDEIQFLEYSISLYNDPNRTIDEIISAFPSDAAEIKHFFPLLIKSELTSEFFKYRKYTFKQLIDQYFKNDILKLFLSILRVDSGQLPSQTSALTDLMLIRGNILDGGYFPKGGMQSLVNSLEEYFRAAGGEVLTDALVVKIKMNKHKATGILLENNTVIKANVIISNSDATFTYNQLLSDAKFSRNILKKINSMLPSTSLFIVYLAINTSLRKYLRHNCSAIWNFEKNLSDGIVCTLPSIVDPDLAPKGCDSVTMYYGMPFKDSVFWEKNRDRIFALFHKRFLRVFPKVENNIFFTKIATPIDLANNTLNRAGASRGWAPTPDQIDAQFPTSETPIKNVFLVGHWVTSYYGNGGVTFAAQTGKKVARQIIKKYANINN